MSYKKNFDFFSNNISFFSTFFPNSFFKSSFTLYMPVIAAGYKLKLLFTTVLASLCLSMAAQQPNPNEPDEKTIATDSTKTKEITTVATDTVPPVKKVYQPRTYNIDSNDTVSQQLIANAKQSLEEQTKKTDEQTKKTDEQTKKTDEQTKKTDEQTKKTEQAKQAAKLLGLKAE